MELQKNAYLCPLFLKYRAGLHLWREGFKGVFVVNAPRIASPRVTATKIFRPVRLKAPISLLTDSLLYALPANHPFLR